MPSDDGCGGSADAVLRVFVGIIITNVTFFIPLSPVIVPFTHVYNCLYYIIKGLFCLSGKIIVAFSIFYLHIFLFPFTMRKKGRETMQVLSKRIRELRQERNMTQHELAAMLHVHRATVAGYEIGRAHV